MRKLKTKIYKFLFNLFKAEKGEVTPIRSVLIFHPGNLGNFISLIPVFHNLKRKQVKITLIVNHGIPLCEILKKNGLIDEFFYFNSGKLIEKLIFLKRFKGKKFDLLISNYMNRYINIQVPLTLITRIPIRVGHTTSKTWENPLDYLFNIKVPFDPLKHEIQSNLDLLRAINFPDDIPFPLLKMEKKHQKDNVICIHPGSSRNFKWKRWSERRFAAVISYIVRKLNKKVYILGTDEDKDSVEKVMSYLKMYLQEDINRVENLCSTLSMNETIDVLLSCEALISNDSGLSKLALALGVQTITIWGPANYFKHKIWDKRLGIDLRIPLECSPCYIISDISKVQNCPHRACLSNITPKMVINALLKLLNQ